MNENWGLNWIEVSKSQIEYCYIWLGIIRAISCYGHYIQKPIFWKLISLTNLFCTVFFSIHNLYISFILIPSLFDICGQSFLPWGVFRSPAKSCLSDQYYIMHEISTECTCGACWTIFLFDRLQASFCKLKLYLFKKKRGKLFYTFC